MAGFSAGWPKATAAARMAVASKSAFLSKARAPEGHRFHGQSSPIRSGGAKLSHPMPPILTTIVQHSGPGKRKVLKLEKKPPRGAVFGHEAWFRPFQGLSGPFFRPWRVLRFPEGFRWSAGACGRRGSRRSGLCPGASCGLCGRSCGCRPRGCRACRN